jgi:hypothetical protein
MDVMLPCYSGRCSLSRSTSIEKLCREIDKSLKAVDAETDWEVDGRGILVISVTERDRNYKQQLEAISQYNEVAIATTAGSHGDYQCWLCLIPVFENLGR